MPFTRQVGSGIPAGSLLARPPAQPGRPARLLRAFRRLRLPASWWIPLLYASVSGAWIALSDLIVATSVRDARQAALWSLIKGMGFVAVTTALLHVGVRLALARQARAYAEVKRNEARLARSELRYRLLAEHVDDVIWTLDLPRRRFTYVSPSILKLRGLSVEEALAEPMERSLTPESLDRVRELMARIGTAREEDPHTGIYDQPCKDGSIKHVEITTTVIRDDGGRPSEVVGVSRDATARVEAERALADRERRLRSILDAALDGFWVLDERGAFLEVNEAACAMIGYSREELLGMRIGNLSVAQGADETAAHLQRIRAKGFDRFESRHRRKDGEVLEVEVSVQHAVLGGDRFVCFVRDISGRKRAQDTVRRSEERFRALIEHASEMIHVLDGEGRFRFWSRSSTEGLGWTPEEQAGTLFLEGVHPDDRDHLAAVFRRLLATPGAVARDTARYRHKDGSWRQVDAVAQNLLQDPAVQGVVINSRDVTAQRQLEDQLRQAQKLDSVGRLAGGVAHDFNNILTVILSCSEALRAELGASSPEARESVEAIREAGERARDLTRQLLAFARKQVIAPVALDLNAVVERSQKMLSRLLGEDVILRVSLAPELWTLHADPGQVEQVLMNLAVNARDAMPRGGTLEIATRNRRVARDGAAATEWVELTVRDDGTGMVPEVQAHLFEPFFTTKEQGKGTGLGLATVYGIVTQAGGQIETTTSPSAGTTFRIRFPRHEGAAASAPAPAPLASTRGTEHILVVEDDPQVRGVLRRALSAEGYLVSALGHPHQALELAGADLEAVKLLVTDVVMPGMNGHALARELATRRPGLLVLYLSGYTRDAISERGALDAGAQFLAKPFTRTSLLEKVRAILDGS